MQKIKIEKIKIFGNHGVYKDEIENGQYFYVDIVYSFNGKLIIEDDLSSVTDYLGIIKFFHEIFNVKRYNLIEKLVNDLSVQMINKFNFQYMKISITKQVDANCSGITVEQETCNE